MWVGLFKNKIIGPYRFKGDVNNGHSYKMMLIHKVMPELQAIAESENVDMDEVHFMQDGAPTHCTNENLAYLRKKFGSRIISRRCPINWPRRSPDLTPLDFAFWAILKNRVYATDSSSKEELWLKIQNECKKLEKENIIPKIMQVFLLNSREKYSNQIGFFLF